MKQKRKLTKSEVQTFLRLVRFARPYWLRLLVGAICSVMGGGSMLALLMVAQNLLSVVFGNQNILQGGDVEPAAPAPIVAPAELPAEAPSPIVATPPTENDSSGFSSFLDRNVTKFAGKYIQNTNLSQLEQVGFTRLVGICVALFLIVIANSIAGFIGAYCLQWVGQRVVMDLRIRFFSHLQKLPVAFFNNSRTGDMISRTIADTQLLQYAVTNVITDAIRQPIILLMMLGFIICIEWKLALFSLILIPVCALPIMIIGRRVRRISREGQQRLADLTSVMQESLAGVMVVKAYGQEAREQDRFSKQCRRFFSRMMSAVKARALSDPINYIIGCIGGIIVLLFSVIHDVPFEQCIIFAGALWTLYEPTKKISRIAMEIQQSSAAADRVFEVLDTPEKIVDKPTAVPLTGPLQELHFDHVHFGYSDDPKDLVFSDLNLRIPAGQSLAVVGPSGCGKTTLISLLLRFFDVTGGAIRVNGTDIRDCTVASLRANIGLVLQETFLFADTVAANIAYGCPQATQEQIEAAAKRANAHDFIMALPQGYQTMLGERGTGLSGGQRQRIAIARAILRDPPILILDEATSALDTEAERLVQADIDRLMGHHTVIVIAHRLSTIAKCDKVAVLGNGGVLEYGTHDELLAQGGVFKRLSALQTVQTEATHAS